MSDTSPPSTSLASASEVGAALGRSSGSIRRWARQGRIPVAEVTYAGSYLFDLEAVREAAQKLRTVRGGGSW